ncbi:MAG: tRNA (guanosine(37)-N1)-methyltransferase TrmD [Thermodesulfobacteriota bacteirum]|nr:tRNA (guanosine(37)-N1)-methyltransferase TrmD [Thermodesulfobacteriota bacterium]
MIFNILSVFKEMLKPSIKYGIISKAIKNKKIKVNLYSYNDFLIKGERLDDSQYGGDPGMVISYNSASKALRHIKENNLNTKTIFLTPKGKKLNNKMVKELSKYDNLSIVCGRYEGFDQRLVDQFCDFEISSGDYIVSGGEIPALIVLDSVSRTLEGVVGNKESVNKDSLQGSLLKHPVYTRPSKLKAGKVPEVLISGNHKKIDKFNRNASLLTTLEKREDLLENAILSREERELLREVKESKIKSNCYLALVHYPVENIKKEVIKTSLTNLDIQDIARSCMTYKIKKYFITHPIKEQRKLAENVLSYWENSKNIRNKNTKHSALELIEIAKDIKEVVSSIKRIHGEKPKIVATDARIMHNMINYSEIREKIETSDSPFLFLFGTGWGLTEEVLIKSDYILKPVGSYSKYNHLSVRSAVAIILDRIFGCNF